MAIRVVRLGTPRQDDEGLRLGTVRRPAPQRLIDLLAALSARQDFSVGCYCADASRCHRSVLGELLRRAGAAMATLRGGGPIAGMSLIYSRLSDFP